MLPFLSNAGLSPPSDSAVVPGRTPSSVSTTSGSPLRWGTSTGTISSAKRPSLMAAAAFSWLAAANVSWRSRETFAEFWLCCSVERPIAMWSNESVRPSYIIESTRVPSPRRNPARAPGSRWGACVMDSMPPATTISASPARIIWSAR